MLTRAVPQVFLQSQIFKILLSNFFKFFYGWGYPPGMRIFCLFLIWLSYIQLDRAGSADHEYRIFITNRSKNKKIIMDFFYSDDIGLRLENNVFGPI
jgi:hypothetical protein